jgi:hypothetical protein
VDVPPATAWFLLRAPAPDEIEHLRTLPHVNTETFDGAAADARTRGFYDDNGLTPAGNATRDQLVAARTDCLRELIDDWQPQANDHELDSMLARLAAELSPQPRSDLAGVEPVAP